MTMSKTVVQEAVCPADISIVNPAPQKSTDIYIYFNCSGPTVTISGYFLYK